MQGSGATKPRWSWRGLTVLGAMMAVAWGGCSSSDAGVTECPPAPFLPRAGEACSFSGQCSYAGATFIAANSWDTCNHVAFECKGGTIHEESTTVYCPGSEPKDDCPADAAEGRACSLGSGAGQRPNNGACRVKGEGQAKTLACACDMPGPLWRCRAVDGT